MSGQVLRHNPDAISLDALRWRPPGLPQHVRVHRATTEQLAGLGWIEPNDSDPTGAKSFLARAAAEQLEAHHSKVVLHPAVGHANPRCARAASAKLNSHATTNSAQLWTSLSRCAPFIVVATAQTPVGVDLEALQTPDQATDLVTLFHPDDRGALMTLREDHFVHEVTAAWTRKEALLKAWGTGLLRDPAVDAVGTHHHPDQPHGWATLSAPSTIAGQTYYLGLAWRTLS